MREIGGFERNEYDWEKRNTGYGAYINDNVARELDYSTAEEDYEYEEEFYREREQESYEENAEIVRRNRERRRRNAIARRHQEQMMTVTPQYVFFLSMALIITCITVMFYIKLQSDITTRLRNIAALESSLDTAKVNNDAVAKRLETSGDITKVKKEALEMGMNYAGEEQVVYYSIDSSDYMTQYGGIK